MIHVMFERPTDQEWRDWFQRARKARKAMIQFADNEPANVTDDDKKPKKPPKPADMIDEELYKEQRLRFLKAFNGKCAYCELKIVPGQRAGDVEHYRPKGRVMNALGKQVFSRDDPHLGYFWLAYHWQNLLPACLACNRPGTDPGGTFSGKWDRFPTENDFWAKKCRDVAKERPLLLNPWKDRPADHLIFDDENGVIGSRTERGRVTIEILGLNREGLPEARRKAYREARLAFRRIIEALARQDEEEIQEIETEVQIILSGKAEFSAVGQAAFANAKREYEERRARLTF